MEEDYSGGGGGGGRRGAGGGTAKMVFYTVKGDKSRFICIRIAQEEEEEEENLVQHGDRTEQLSRAGKVTDYQVAELSDLKRESRPPYKFTCPV